MIEENEDIDDTATCGPDVEFDFLPEIHKNVVIGHGGEFGYNFDVGESSVIGDFVIGEDEVTLGQFVCVEKGTFLKKGLKVKDYAMVQTKGMKDSKVILAKPDSMFVLDAKGKCQPKKR